jgi:hypothetical protein
MIKLEDRIVFKLKGREYLYRVDERFLQRINHEGNPMGGNRDIFVDLDEKYEDSAIIYELAEKVYGMPAVAGNWPQPSMHPGPEMLKTLEKMVIWVHEQCNLQNVKYYEKERV